MKHFAIIILLLVALCTNAQQQDRKIRLSGRVYDSFTEMYVPNTKITLMSSDSTVIDTVRVGVNRMNNVSLTTYYLIYAPARIGKYIIKLENPNYQTCFLDIEIKRLGRRTGISGPDAKMKMIRKKGGLYGENKLGEVIVKATKVQFFYKGDTIVYSADAFNLPEGSMLDALIRQMPGAKLTEDGEIYIHGKKVDYLTLNGKKMFDGNGQVLLQNLPHYAVRELKVFEQNQEHQIGTGIESLKKDYVLDVALKREYDGHNFGQVELGVGTKDRRLGRLFDSYNRESLQMMGYVNLNNVNQTRDPGQDGSFSESDGPRSIVENKQFGVSVSKEKAHGNFSNVLSVKGAIRNSDTDFQKTEQTHLSSSEIFKSTTSQQHSRVSSLQASNRLILRKPFFFSSTTNVSYNDGKNRKNYATTTYDGLQSMENVTNKSILHQLGKDHSLSLSQNFNVYKLLEWGDELNVKAGMSYNEGCNKKDESQRIEYPRAALDSLYEYLANENVRTKGYELIGKANYKFNFPSGFGIELEYNYIQGNNSKDRFRLKDSEIDNSYHTNSVHRENRPGIVFSYKNKVLTLASGVRVNFIKDRMSYQCEQLDTLIRKSYTDFFPDFRISWKSGGSYFEFYNKYGSWRKPEVLDLVEVVDDSNPLVMTKGNKDLKKWRMYDYQLWYDYHGGKRDFNISFTSQSQFLFDFIEKTVLYEEASGASLITPYNVGSIFTSYNALGIGFALNRAKSVRLQSNLNYEPSKYINLTGTTQTGLKKTTCYEHPIEEKLTLSYQYKKATWRLVSGLKYSGQRCRENASVNYDAWDIHYGMSVNCYLPWKIQFAGDINMYSRREYNTDAINGNHVISNLSLSRAFFKSRLLVKAKMFDIFHELTSIDRWTDRSQITEATYKCIPRYGMLSVCYRFGKK